MTHFSVIFYSIYCREIEPFGLAGGKAGQSGENWYIDTQEKQHKLTACTEVDVPAGGSILIKTPGGGGFGTKS